MTCDDDDDVTTKAEAEPASLVPELLPSTPFSLLLSEQRKKASAKQETDRQNLHPGVPGSTYLKEVRQASVLQLFVGGGLVIRVFRKRRIGEIRQLGCSEELNNRCIFVEI